MDAGEGSAEETHPGEGGVGERVSEKKIRRMEITERTRRAQRRTPENASEATEVKKRKGMPAREYDQVDKYILDNGEGGSGQRLDW